MENTVHTILLADGTEIQATLNGNNYITDQDISAELLADDNLTTLSIDGEAYSRYTCTNFWHEADGYHFIIREITAEEWAMRQVNAQIEYLAMMTEVDL